MKRQGESQLPCHKRGVLLHRCRDVSPQRRPAIRRLRCLVLPFLLGLPTGVGVFSSRFRRRRRRLRSELGHAGAEAVHLAPDDELLPLEGTPAALEAAVLDLAGVGALVGDVGQGVGQPADVGAELVPRAAGAGAGLGYAPGVGGGVGGDAGEEGGVADEALVLLGGEEGVRGGGPGAEELLGGEGVDLARQALVADCAG